MSLRGIAVGDVIFIQRERRRSSQPWPDPTIGVVSKVGRKWITTDRQGWAERFEIDSGRSDGNHNDWANGLGKWAFRSDAARARYVREVVEREEIIGAVRDALAFRWRDWPIDSLRALRDVVVAAEQERKETPEI